MTEEMNVKDVDAFMRKLQLLVCGAVAFILVPLIGYAIYFEMRLGEFEENLSLSSPEQLESENSLPNCLTPKYVGIRQDALVSMFQVVDVKSASATDKSVSRCIFFRMFGSNVRHAKATDITPKRSPFDTMVIQSMMS